MAYASEKDGSTSCETKKTYLVLVGITGDGKSTTGVTLAGLDPKDKKAFKTSAGWKSETSKCSFADFDYDGHSFRIVDTPGLADTNLTPEQLHERFAGFCDLAPEGVDAFLFLVKQGRFNPNVFAAFNMFKEACSKEALKHTIMVVSAAVQLDCDSDNDDALCWSQRAWKDDLMEQASEIDNFTETLEQLDRRVVGVENKRGGNKNRQQAREHTFKLVDKVRKQNNYSRYCNDELKKAEEWRASIKKAAEGLEEQEAQQTLLNELSECFNGRKTRDQVETKMNQLKTAQEKLHELKDLTAKAKQAADDAEKKAQDEARLKGEAHAATIKAQNEANAFRAKADEQERKYAQAVKDLADLKEQDGDEKKTKKKKKKKGKGDDSSGEEGSSEETYSKKAGAEYRIKDNNGSWYHIDDQGYFLPTSKQKADVFEDVDGGKAIKVVKSSKYSGRYMAQRGGKGYIRGYDSNPGMSVFNWESGGRMLVDNREVGRWDKGGSCHLYFGNWNGGDKTYKFTKVPV